jgi:hypothetical protein
MIPDKELSMVLLLLLLLGLVVVPETAAMTAAAAAAVAVVTILDEAVPERYWLNSLLALPEPELKLS